MKHSLKCVVVWITDKLRVEVRALVNDAVPAVREFTNGDNHNISYNIMPSMVFYIVKPRMEGEDRGVWNPNDSLLCTKQNLPIFCREFRSIYEGMKTPNLYTYTDGRLELDEAIGETIRKVFMIGPTTVELSPVVIIQDKPDGSERLEGIKIKFNNENSSVMLTLNEAWSILWNIEHCDIDSVTLQMYNIFISTGSKVISSSTLTPTVDIKPLQKAEDVL